MKLRTNSSGFFSEAIIFLFPLLSESCAFSAAIYVKNSGFENGSSLLFLLAVVKLACSVLEYKGFEDAYLTNAVGMNSVFVHIGLIQLIQGIVLPSIIIAFVEYALSWSIDPLFVSLLIWTGVLTSLRQFLSYHWRAQVKSSSRVRWQLISEIVLAYVWLGLLTAAALGHKTRFAQELSILAVGSWKLWFIFVFILAVIFIKKSGWNLGAKLSRTQWGASIVQAFTSQLSKEFFIMATTTSVTSGFIARTVLTLYGLTVVYPLTFFRIRIFDRNIVMQSEKATGSETADQALRKIGLILGGGYLVTLPLAGYLRRLTNINFPFFAALLAIGLIYPIVAYEVLAYFELIKRGRRSRFSTAAAAGGVFAIVVGYVAARSFADASMLTFLFIAILGISDFIVNRVSKIFAYR